MKIAIRADGGPEKGFGHIVRSGTVAKEFLEKGHEVYYFTSSPEAVKSRLPNAEIVEISRKNHKEETVREIENKSIDSIFIDNFAADIDFQKAVRNTKAKVVFRQNFQHVKVCCDIMVYGDIYAKDFNYEWTGKKPYFLLGTDYLLLRKEFQKVAKKDKKWSKSLDRCLIIMGGSDVNNSTPKIMRKLDHLNLTTDVIIGPGFTDKEEIKDTAQNLRNEFNLIEDPANIAEIMFKADFAITSAGGTAYELLAAQTPFITIPEVENQELRAECLRKSELSLLSENLNQLDEEINKIKKAETRRDLFNNLKGLVDGKGPERVYNKIINTRQS